MTAQALTVAPPPAQTEEFDFSDLLDTLLQRKWLVIGILLLTLALGVVYATIATPIYRADALVQVERGKTSTLSSIQSTADALGGGDSPVTGEIEILLSREVLLQAIEDTQADVSIAVTNRFPVIGEWLARRYQHSRELAPALFDLDGLDGYAWGGEVLQVAQFIVPPAALGASFTLIPTGPESYQLLDAENNELARGKVHDIVPFDVAGAPAQISVSAMRAAPSTRFAISRSSPIATYRHIRGGLTAEETSFGSNILRVSYQHPDMAFAGELVNAIARAYLTQNVERRSAEADQSLAFLEAQLPEIKRHVSQAEEALKLYRTQTQTFSVDSTAGSLLTQSVDAERRRLELELQREALLERYRPNHPAVRVIDEQINTTARESEKLNEHVNTLPMAQRDLLRLQRDADVSNQIYIGLLNNAEQLRVAKAGTVGNVRVIDYAIMDDAPVAPQKSMIVAIAGLAGLALGVAAALLARVLRPTLRDAEEVERATGLAVYVTIPESPQQQKLDAVQSSGRKTITGDGQVRLLAQSHPEDLAVESLRSLRTGLTFALMGAANKNIVITGATPSIGKTFVAANLAVLLASAGQRVLLIETDLRRPRMGRYFGYRKVAGLSDVLAGTADLAAVLRKSTQPTLRLDVLPAGALPPNPGELLLNAGFGKLLADMQEHYDHIVLDTAPLLPVADTLAVARHASTIFLVARAEANTASELREATRKLEGAGLQAKGVILNGLKRRRLRYGYSYNYAYN